MGNHFCEPGTFAQFTRRSILKSTPAIAAPLALVAIQASAGEIDQERHLDQLLVIAKCTGLSLDNMIDWFDDVDLTRIAENVSNWRETRIPGMQTNLPMERAHYHADQLRKEMQHSMAANGSV